MTWFAHKIVIFDIFKDVTAWGRKTGKFRGETEQVLRNNFFPLGLHSSTSLRRAETIIMNTGLEYTLRSL